jgi:hypothetical protein
VVLDEEADEALAEADEALPQVEEVLAEAVAEVGVWDEAGNKCCHGFRLSKSMLYYSL